MELSFTDDALEDVRLIVRYGLDRVTGMNVDRYVTALDEALDRLEIYPLLGRNADDVSSGLRVLPVGSHRIFYRIRPGIVLIVRVLHHRADTAIVEP